LWAEQAIQSEEGATLDLANDKVAIVFDAADGAITSIKNRSLGVDYSVGRPSACLFLLKYLDSEARKQKDLLPQAGSLTNHALTMEGGRQTLTLDYLVPWQPGGAVQIECQASLEDESNEVRWKISVDNQAKGLEIVEVVFPILSGLRIGARAEDNFLTWPAWGAGHLIPNPQNSTDRRGAYLGGGATMPWVDLFRKQAPGAAANEEPACGLYFASYDKTLLMTELSRRVSADHASLTIQMSKYAHVRRGDRWTSGDFVTRLHGGDWHVAADAYRSWFTSWSPSPEQPQWLKQCDGRLELTLPSKSRFCTRVGEQVRGGQEVRYRLRQVRRADDRIHDRQASLQSLSVSRPVDGNRGRVRGSDSRGPCTGRPFRFLHQRSGLGPVREAGVAVLGGKMTSIAPGSSAKRVPIRVPPDVLSAVLLVHRGTGVIDEARRAEQLAPRIQPEK
ncbi:MAG: hypothetical protein ABIK89_23170, partial [Planctomycetota bacterium]